MFLYISKHTHFDFALCVFVWVREYVCLCVCGCTRAHVCVCVCVHFKISYDGIPIPLSDCDARGIYKEYINLDTLTLNHPLPHTFFGESVSVNGSESVMVRGSERESERESELVRETELLLNNLEAFCSFHNFDFRISDLVGSSGFVCVRVCVCVCVRVCVVLCVCLCV